MTAEEQHQELQKKQRLDAEKEAADLKMREQQAHDFELDKEITALKQQVSSLELEVKKTAQGSVKLNESTRKCEDLEGQLRA